MKKNSIFVVSTPKTNIDFKVTDVYSFCKQAICYKYNRVAPSCGLLYLISQLFVFGETEGGSPSFIFKYLNFSFMPKTMKNASMVNNSTHISTDSHETALFLISELNKLASTLSTKITININIQTIIGNNNVANSGAMYGGVSINSKNVLL